MSSKYSPEFIGQIRKWYLEEGKSDSDIPALAAKLNPPVILTRNAVIGVRQRATPPIMRPAGAQNETRDTAAKLQQRNRETKPAPPARTPAPKPITTPKVPAPVQRPPKPYERKASLRDRTGPTLLELGPDQCRNPVGPDATWSAPQMFCGDRVGYRDVEIRKGVFEARKDSYCPTCAARNRTRTAAAAAAGPIARAAA